MSQEYILHETHTYLKEWKASSDFFQCPSNQKYVILCDRHWKVVQRQLENQLESGQAPIITIAIAIALCVLIIACLFFYTLHLKKKLQRLEHSVANEEPLNRLNTGDIDNN